MATSPQAAHSPGYERTDASPRGLIIFAMVIAVILAVLSLALILLFKHYEKIENPARVVAAPFASVEPQPPPPRIQRDPEADMQSYLKSQQDLINTYGWIDRQNRIVRLPIERAMELLLERGLPTRSPNPPEKSAAAEQRNRSTANSNSGAIAQ